MNNRLLYSLRLTLLTIVCGIVASCDNLIYDGEGECVVKYTVSFEYVMNMEYADAFAHYVKTLTLCAFDSDGTLVYTKTEDGETLVANDQTMDVSDITPGIYTLIAWAQGEETQEDCYSFADLEIGKTTIDELQCYINRDYDDEEGAAIIDHDLTPLFHGMVEEGDLSEIEYSGERNVLVSLTKDTNVIRVVLQHLSGADIDVDEFTFRITDSNGWLDYDNSLLDDEQLTYKPWSQTSGTASVADEDEDDETLTSVGAVVAEMTMGRLVYGQSPRLTIYNSDGDKVLSIPIIDYALLIKGNYNSSLDEQEYLDRQDEYSMTFFLDEDDTWISTTIIINSWRLVFQEIDLWQ